MATATKKEKKKLTLGRPALVAGTQQTLSNLFETFDIYEIRPLDVELFSVLKRSIIISDQFIPERWIEDKQEIHPFAIRPFGHGPRMCIGKRFAELEIQLGIVKLLQNFRVEWASKDSISPLSKMINVPDKKLQFKFIDL
jgi:hypothetical protein